MNVHNNEKDELKQLQGVLSVFADIETSDDPAQPGHSEQLEQTEHSQHLVLCACQKEHQVVERNRTQEVHHKSTFEVVISDDLQIHNLVSRNWMVKGCSKRYEDIHAE